ncbi:MAG: response regulator [Calditrichaeota bacterium]|nr:MAG: response regulator [Calditrichota bacterium]
MSEINKKFYKKYDTIIAVSVFVLLAISSSYIWKHEDTAQYDIINTETKVTADQLKQRLESWVGHRLSIIERIGDDWEKYELKDSAKFVTKAEELLLIVPGLQALNWIDNNWEIKTVVPYAENQKALGKNLHDHPFNSVEEALANASESHQLTRTSIVNLLQGGKGFATYMPVVDKSGKVTGYINGVFKINKLIEGCFTDKTLLENFDIQISENVDIVFSNQNEEIRENTKYLQQREIKILDKSWSMLITPSQVYLQPRLNNNAFGYLILFNLFGLLLSWVIRVALVRHKKTFESEKKFRTLVEGAGDSFFLLNIDGKIIDVNKKTCKELGYSRDELLNMNIHDIDMEVQHEEYLRLWNLIEQNKIDNVETVYKRKNSSTFPVEIRVGIVTLDGESFATCLARNISEAKRLKELESRAQKLETAGQIAGQVAHDFNNLLSPIVAYPEFIRELISDNPEAIELLDVIEKSAIQIADINQELLTLGRRGHYSLEVFNLNDVISQSMNHLEYDNNAIKIDFQKSNDLFPMKGGKSQISRIIINLINNAIDAIDDTGEIEIKTENYYVEKLDPSNIIVPSGSYIKLTISDTGRGIPSDIMSSIFLPFVSTKKVDKKRGSGLGLSVVDAVVKDHNGFIDTKSKVGEGTSFYVYFPVTEDEIINTTDVKIQGGGESILVVDDDAVLKEVTTKILNKLGYKVQAVECGEKALELLKTESFDLLLLDMIIPEGMDGTELFEKSLLLNPHQRAIIVSGYAESERVQKAMDLGVACFLKKPFTSQQLAITLAEAFKEETMLVSN